MALMVRNLTDRRCVGLLGRTPGTSEGTEDSKFSTLALPDFN
jgi:hypothetical protein